MGALCGIGAGVRCGVGPGHTAWVLPPEANDHFDSYTVTYPPGLREYRWQDGEITSRPYMKDHDTLSDEAVLKSAHVAMLDGDGAV